MTTESGQEKQPIHAPEHMGDVDELLARRIENAEARQEAERKANKKLAKLQKRIDKINHKMRKVTVPLEKHDDEIDHTLASYLIQKRKSILRRFGKTVHLQHGVITFVVRARDVDTSEDVRDAVRYLESRPEWEEYLIQPPKELNKRALATCQDFNLLRALRRRGVRVSQHEFVHIKPTGFQKAIMLSRRLYPNRR